MKIKSLLIGSMLGTAASSLVAVSGAHAADPIIYAEPEPMEYVRVCDVYGAGYYYIPGTETCLSINGYIWYQMGATSDRGLVEGDTPNYHGFTEGRWNKGTRARVNIDARSETEWGTLRGFIRFQGDMGDYNGSTARPNVALDQGYLELGGFRAGYGDSAWVATQNSGVASYGSHTWGGLYYGFQRRAFLQYSMGFADGFHATIALEDDGEGVDGFGVRQANYMPDVVGLVGVNQGWGGAWLRAAYDDGRSGALESGWAAQAGLQFNTAPGSSLRLIGFYSSADINYGSGSPLGPNSEWSILASYQHQVMSDLSLSVGGQYFSDIYAPGSDAPLVPGRSIDAWALEASAIWTPVQNFEVRAEYVYQEVDDLDGSHSGFLRFQRSF